MRFVCFSASGFSAIIADASAFSSSTTQSPPPISSPLPLVSATHTHNPSHTTTQDGQDKPVSIISSNPTIHTKNPSSNKRPREPPSGYRSVKVHKPASKHRKQKKRKKEKRAPYPSDACRSRILSEPRDPLPPCPSSPSPPIILFGFCVVVQRGPPTETPVQKMDIKETKKG